MMFSRVAMLSTLTGATVASSLLLAACGSGSAAGPTQAPPVYVNTASPTPVLPPYKESELVATYRHRYRQQDGAAPGTWLVFATPVIGADWALAYQYDCNKTRFQVKIDDADAFLVDAEPEGFERWFRTETQHPGTEAQHHIRVYGGEGCDFTLAVLGQPHKPRAAVTLAPTPSPATTPPSSGTPQPTLAQPFFTKQGAGSQRFDVQSSSPNGFALYWGFRCDGAAAAFTVEDISTGQTIVAQEATQSTRGSATVYADSGTHTIAVRTAAQCQWSLIFIAPS